MTDASDRPVDGAEPRSALEPVPEPVRDAPVDPADEAVLTAEPADGEAMPATTAPPPGSEPWAEADVATGAGLGSPDGGSAPLDGDGTIADGPVARSGTASAEPASGDDAHASPAEVDVATGAGIGEPGPEGDARPEPEGLSDARAAAPGAEAAAEAPAPVAEASAPEAAAAGPTAPGAGAPAPGAEAVAEAPAPVAEASAPEAAAAGPTAPGAEAPAPEAEAPVPEAEAEAPAPAAATHDHGVPPTLPPPPPELAEVPADAGRIVSGRVREVRGEDVIVDLDDGRTGVVNRRNLGLDGDPAQALPVGSPIEGAVLARSDPQRRVVLSRTWALKKRAWESIAAAAAEGTTLTGRVVSVGQKGVVVDVGVRGFVPASHLELSPVSELQGYAGQELSLKVLDVDVDRERLVLSRRSLLLKEQRRSLHDVLSSLRPGEVRRGRVATLSDYGAFVDLGGVNGLVHLSELSWHRVRHPSEVLAVGDEVDVKVLDVKVKKRRVSLSIRQLTDDPLASVVPGEIRTGPVTRLVDFGAFVDLSGVEGLVHLSELAEYRVSAPEEIVAPGEEVRVKVLSVDRRRRRVELSIRQAAEYGG